MFGITTFIAFLLQLLPAIAEPMPGLDLFSRIFEDFGNVDRSGLPLDILDWGHGVQENEIDVLESRGAPMTSGHECQPRQFYNVSHQFAIEDPPALISGVVCNATYSGNVGWYGRISPNDSKDAVLEILWDTP